VHRWDETTRAIHCPANCGEQLQFSREGVIDIVINTDQSWSAKQSIICPTCAVRFRIERCIVYPVRPEDLKVLFSKGKTKHAAR
jgi:hypothetical protein